MNLSTSSAHPYGNSPAAYAEVPNPFQLDQLTLYVERTPDTIQTDHFDWGFRFTNLYGLDYRFTTADGYFSKQLLDSPQKNGSVGQRPLDCAGRPVGGLRGRPVGARPPSHRKLLPRIQLERGAG